MRKKRLEKRLQKLIAKKADLKARCDASQDVAEVRELTRQLEDINDDIEEVQDELAEIEAEEEAAAEEEARSAAPASATLVNGNVVGQFQTSEEKRNENIYASKEYREEFKNFVQRGIRPSDKYKYELRSPALATTTKYAAVIPTTIMDEIIKDLEEDYGSIYSLVRKMNVQGGVKFAVADLEVTWNWVDEDKVSDEQDAGTANSYVTFGYNVGEARVAESLLLNIVKLESFEQEFAAEIAKAYLKAMDYGIINGSGDGTLLGILQDERLITDLAATNIIEMTEADMESWVDWKKKFVSKIKRKYRKNGTFVFAGETVDEYLSVIRDKNDRPLYVEAAGLSMDDNGDGRFLGKPCKAVDSSIIDDFSTASVGDIVGIFGDFSKYAVNSNREFVVDKWENKDNNKMITRGLTIADGKMLLPKCFFLIKKAATPTL